MYLFEGFCSKTVRFGGSGILGKKLICGLYPALSKIIFCWSHFGMLRISIRRIFSPNVYVFDVFRKCMWLASEKRQRCEIEQILRPRFIFDLYLASHELGIQTGVPELVLGLREPLITIVLECFRDHFQCQW